MSLLLSLLARTRAGLAVVLVLLPAAACRPAGEAGRGRSSEVAIAAIGGAPVMRCDFDAYAADVLRTESEQPPETPPPELMSRLLDRFLDEELVAREAEKRGMEVSEREVTEALRSLQSPESAEASRSPEEQARARARMRRALLMRKFREQEVLRDLVVDEEEIRAYYEAHRDEFQQAAQLVLRQMLIEDEAEAKQIRDDLARDPSRFQEIAERRSVAPDAGRPRAYAEADLPPELIAAVAKIPVGGISDVVTNPEGSRIFLVERRQPERLVGLEEASDRIRVALLQEKGRQAYDAFMEKLRDQAGLVIHEENIPFAYRRRSS